MDVEAALSVWLGCAVPMSPSDWQHGMSRGGSSWDVGAQAYDRVTPKTEVKVRPTRAAAHNVTVSDDPVVKCDSLTSAHLSS